MSEVNGKGRRVPTRHGNNPIHREWLAPFSNLTRRIAEKHIECERPAPPKHKPMWGRSGPHDPTTLLTDDEVREIRRLREIEGLKAREIFAKFRERLPSKDYLYRVLGYQTRGLIFPEDKPGIKRK